MTVKTERVSTLDLRVGDVVWQHGMALELVSRREEPHNPARNVVSFDTVLLNRQEIVSRAARDRSAGIANSTATFILASLSGGRCWAVQGNELASWDREVSA